ncbi:MAG: ABC transporter permease, partial [Calditrichaeota bacterium]|nr:ABC transporter permease [Calditrichota bacterium]
PVIAILFLFVGIFTSSGFLFRSIVDEKSERVVESLLSSASSFQLVGGKIFGLGLLGLFQVLIWMSMAGLLILINLIPVKDIILLTFENAGLFLL